MSKAAELAALIGSQTAQTNRNMMINGAMQVSQRSTSVASITSTGYQTLDRFNFLVESLGTWTMSQDTDVPTGYGFAKSLKIDCTTADGSPAVADRLLLRQTLEGFDVQRMKKGTSNAESVTLSFWVKATKTGTHIINLYDNDNNRYIAQAYTVSSSNTWEHKSMTFVGDTTGAFDDDAAGSLQIVWWLGAGTNSTSGTLQTSWGSATAANRAVGQVNTGDNTDNNWAITGVQLEIGEVATAFEHENVADTFRKCQRYYAKSWSLGSAVTTNPGVVGAACVGNANRAFGNVFWPVTMRAAPTVVWYSGSAGTSNKWRNSSSGTDITAASAIAGIGESGYGYVLSSGIDAITDTLQGHYEAESEL